jgi:hypothetical protein
MPVSGPHYVYLAVEVMKVVVLEVTGGPLPPA